MNRNRPPLRSGHPIRGMLLAAMLVTPVAIPAQTTQPTPGPTGGARTQPGEDIVVDGRKRERKEITQSVRQVTRESDGQIPRWHTTFCVAVFGADEPHRRLVTETIKHIADDAGAKAISGDCHPEVKILLSKDADAFAQAFNRVQPTLYKDVFRFGIAHGDEQARWLDPAPVRWLIESQDEKRLGFASNIARPVRETKLRMMVLVDLTRCNGKTWQQLAGYLAMVVLANPKQGDAGPPGIDPDAVRHGFDAGPRRSHQPRSRDVEGAVPQP